MPSSAIAFGIILILQGIITYFISESKSPTAFIPAIFGVLLAIFGFVGKNPNLRKHAMHGAAAVALLGVLGGLGRGIMKLAQAGTVNLAIGSMLLMGVICLVFLIMCIRSFIAARRARTAA